jgi:uncharacterized protein (DUF58 family)
MSGSKADTVKHLHRHDHKTVANLQSLIKMQYLARSLPLSGPQRVNSLMVGRHQSRTRGRGMDFQELRHYRVGDDIRQMDWKVTNRTRKPHVRVYSEERERPVVLVVDQRPTMFFGSQRMMKSVVAAEVAALLSWHVVHRGDRIGMLIFDDEQTTEVRPGRSQNQIMHILNLLCDYGERLSLNIKQGHHKELNPAGPCRLNQILVRAKNLVSHDALIHIVSDLDQADEETDELLSQLVQHNNVAINFIFDPLEQALPQRGRLAVSDGRFQVELDTSDKTLQENYARDFDARLARIRGFLKKRSIPVLPISTTETVDSQLIRLLGGN